MKFFVRLVIIGTALLMSQLPLFVDQYDMRLEAHIEEAKIVVSKIQTIAGKQGVSPETYIAKFVASSNPDMVAQGLFMKELIDRYDDLTLFHARLKSRNALMRPIFFAFSCDRAIAVETLYGFHIGFVFTLPVIVWGLLGTLLGYIIVVLYRKKKASWKE